MNQIGVYFFISSPPEVFNQGLAVRDGCSPSDLPSILFPMTMLTTYVLRASAAAAHAVVTH